MRDELNEGDQILVKVLALEGNKIKLSRKAVLKEQRDKLKAVQLRRSTSNGMQANACIPVKLLTFKYLAARCRSGFLAGGAALFHGRLPIALFQSRQRNGKHELLLAVIVEFDHDVFFRAGSHRTETVLGVLDLCALRESWFECHRGYC